MSFSGAAAGTMIAIQDEQPSLTEDVAQVRCLGFAYALMTIRNILNANPITGVDFAQGAPLDWAVPHARIRTLSDDKKAWIDHYMQEFAPIRIPSLIPNRELYQKDKAFCQPLLGKH